MDRKDRSRAFAGVVSARTQWPVVRDPIDSSKLEQLPDVLPDVVRLHPILGLDLGRLPPGSGYVSETQPL
jgi:hypothetical protein